MLACGVCHEDLGPAEQMSFRRWSTESQEALPGINEPHLLGICSRWVQAHHSACPCRQLCCSGLQSARAKVCTRSTGLQRPDKRRLLLRLLWPGSA